MTTPTPATSDRPEGTCCGGGMSWQPKAGEPLAHSCQLCPASPTYHASDKVRADEGARPR